MLGSELAKAGAPAIIGPNALVFRFPARYTQSKESVAKPDRVARIEEALRRVTEKPWAVRIEVDDAVAPLVMPAEAAPAKPKAMPKEEAERVPVVKRALDVLGATIQRVDEGFAQESTAERNDGS